MKFLPWLYADKNGKNCKIKGLRVFYFFNDKEDQIEMLNEWIKGLTEARDKILETSKPKEPPKTSDIIKQIAASPEKQKEVAQATKNIYMAINAEKRRTRSRKVDLIEDHLIMNKTISAREALELYKCKSLPSVISILRAKKMHIINRIQQNGLFRERVYIYQGGKQ